MVRSAIVRETVQRGWTKNKAGHQARLCRLRDRGADQKWKFRPRAATQAKVWGRQVAIRSGNRPPPNCRQIAASLSRVMTKKAGHRWGAPQSIY